MKDSQKKKKNNEKTKLERLIKLPQTARLVSGVELNLD